MFGLFLFWNLISKMSNQDSFFIRIFRVLNTVQSFIFKVHVVATLSGNVQYLITSFSLCQQLFSSFFKMKRRRRELNPRAAINDLHPFQGCPFSLLGTSPDWLSTSIQLTERVGFEPTRPCGQTVFKTASLWPLRYLSICLLLFCTSKGKNYSIINFFICQQLFLFFRLFIFHLISGLG